MTKVKITVCSTSGRHKLILCCVLFFFFFFSNKATVAQLIQQMVHDQVHASTFKKRFSFVCFKRVWCLQKACSFSLIAKKKQNKNKKNCSALERSLPSILVWLQTETWLFVILTTTQHSGHVLVPTVRCWSSSTSPLRRLYDVFMDIQ